MAETQHPHHRHLEQARSQVIELLSRQAIERDIVSRSENRNQDVVAGLVARQQRTQLSLRLAQFHPADVAFVLEALAPEARAAAWDLVGHDRRGAVLLEAADAVRRQLVAAMPADEIAATVAPLDSDDIADLIAELPDEQRADVLARLDQSDQAAVRSVLSFPDGTVGAEMDLDFVSVREDASLDAVLRYLRRRGRLPDDTNQIFVVDRQNHLRGVLSLEHLLLGDPEQSVAELMDANPRLFYTDDPVHEAVGAFERYDLITAPVLNLQNQVVGRITVDSVLDSLNERLQRQRLEEVGLSEDQDVYAPIPQAARERWAWLGINLATAFISSRVIGAFEDIILQLVALATLMPIVASMGGNTGNQTVALVIRGLALGQLGGPQLKRLVWRELAVSAYNGVIWGAVLGLAALLLYQNLGLALVISVAMLLNLIVAATVGIFAPVLLDRFGRDPVRGSSIILTFATDSMGFLIFLGLASLVLT
ncbi:MAG: magnesium transporter [Gammaproteobacteria bacterium]|nr:magnesium transporter [Gammaproteobacteria bacterium]